MGFKRVNVFGTSFRFLYRFLYINCLKKILFIQAVGYSIYLGICHLPYVFSPPYRYENYSRPSSPFLVPLTKYLDRYASETMDYFLDKEKLGQASTGNLLVRQWMLCWC